MTEPNPVRLFVTDRLAAGAEIVLGREQSHYLVTVMRRGAGAPVLLFNGRDGEWRARVTAADRKGARLVLEAATRPQPAEPDLWLLFAPLKKDRTDFVVEKSTELGAARILPVLTARARAARVNIARLQATANEAAEQCGRLSVPEIAAARPLADVVDDWPEGRRLIFLDESGQSPPLLAVLGATDGPLAVLVGPEGGFAGSELDLLGKLPFAAGADLGPRVLRAETAATAALAIRQAARDLAGATPSDTPGND